MPPLTQPPAAAPESADAERARAEEFCRKHFGNSVSDLGWDDHIAPAIERGEDVVVACEELADDYDLDYIDGQWGGAVKPDVSRERRGD